MTNWRICGAGFLAYIMAVPLAGEGKEWWQYAASSLLIFTALLFLGANNRTPHK